MFGLLAIALLLLAVVVAGALQLRKALRARWGARVALLPLLALGDLLAGLLVAGAILVAGFLDAAFCESASEKARLIADHIAEALNCGAAVCVLSLPIFAVSLLWLVVGWARPLPEK